MSRLEVVDGDDSEQWWCNCADRDAPHVHCPWGGMHIHIVNPETGERVRDDG